MSNHALFDWLGEASGDIAGGQQSPMAGGGPPTNEPAPTQNDPNVAKPAPAQPDPEPVTQQPNMPDNAGQTQQDVSQDPATPDMPEEKKETTFEEWKSSYFKESIKGDVSSLIDLIHSVRDHDLEAYPRKFVEDNLQICFLRQNANIDKASKEIRKVIRDDLDQNNPSVSVVNHITNVMESMPELNNIFIKLKGLLGLKGDLHRKFIASIIGGVQVGSGANTEDVIFNDKTYSIRLSTRFNDKWGRVDIGKWSLKQDDVDDYLTEPERRRLEDGSPEEKDVLRRRVVMESIADAFKKRGFIINVVNQDGTIYTLGWDIAGCLQGAYTSGKLVVKTIQSENNESMINSKGEIIPYVDIKIKYVKTTSQLNDEGKPVKEEHDFMERIDGMLFLTAPLHIVKEAAASFTGIVLKETPYNGNPSDLRVLQRCIPSTGEILLRNC